MRGSFVLESRAMGTRRWSMMISSTLCVLAIGIGGTRAEEAAPRELWSGALSTGWDSLYMFRGANQLPGFSGYGSSISWTGATLSWAATEADSLTIGNWTAFGLGVTDYKETDAYAIYTRAIGDLSLSLGYSLYAVVSETNGLYANEVNVAAGYDIRWGAATLTPGVFYAFNLGPAPGQGGYVEQTSSYLEIRVDADIPLPGWILSLAPWMEFGINFRYNTTDQTDPPSPFAGADHLEFGMSLPVAIGGATSIAPYAASSFQWAGLPDTRPVTLWGGVSVTVAF